MSCGVGPSCGSDLALLWLWRRPVATAPFQPLAWEPPYAAGSALKRPKTNKQTNKQTKKTQKKERNLKKTTLLLNVRKIHVLIISPKLDKFSQTEFTLEPTLQNETKLPALAIPFNIRPASLQVQ